MVRFDVSISWPKYKNIDDFIFANDQPCNRKSSFGHKYALLVVLTTNLLYWYYPFDDAIHT